MNQKKKLYLYMNYKKAFLWKLLFEVKDTNSYRSVETVPDERALSASLILEEKGHYIIV